MPDEFRDQSEKRIRKIIMTEAGGDPNRVKVHRNHDDGFTLEILQEVIITEESSTLSPKKDEQAA